MRQRLVIIVTLIVVIAALVLINAASYVKVEQTVDSEMTPDRSTLNAGATGTRAFYDFLHESGYQVARWRENTASTRNSNLLPVGRNDKTLFGMAWRLFRPTLG